MIFNGCKKENRLLFCSLLCSFWSNILTMEKDPYLLFLYAKQIISSLESIPKPLSKSFTQQAFETTKQISLKVISSCYNHPKLFIGATGMTIFFIALKRLSLLPISKYDLKKFKEESKLKANRQLQQFFKDNDADSQESAQQLIVSIESSQTQLKMLLKELEENEDNVHKFPQKVAHSLAAQNTHDDDHHNKLFKQAHKNRTTQFNNFETHAEALMQEDNQRNTNYLEKLSQELLVLKRSFEESTDELIEVLKQENEILMQATHDFDEQDKLQRTQINKTINNQNENLTERIDALAIFLKDLAYEEESQNSINTTFYKNEKKEL